MRTAIAGAALLSVLALSSASATSLGAFDAPVLDGYTDDVEVCTGTATLFGSGLPLSLPATLLFTPLDLTSVTGLAGDCEGLTPVLVVIGVSGAGPAVEDVLGTHTFATPVPPSATVVVDTISEPLRSLGFTDPFATVTQLRVAFVP